MKAGEWGALEDSARDEIIDRSIIAEKSGFKSESHLGGKFELPFGATQVFPRLKVATGQRRVVTAAAATVDDAGGSQGEDIDSASSTSVSENQRYQESWIYAMFVFLYS